MLDETSLVAGLENAFSKLSSLISLQLTEEVELKRGLSTSQA